MKYVAVIRSALKAICRNPTRTFLTTLGIVIGIAAVIALMEIGKGAQEALKKNIANMGVNTIRVWPGAVTKSGVRTGSGGRVNLTLTDLNAIAKNCRSVSAVSPVVSVRGQIIYGGQNWNPFFINGVNEKYLDISNWEISDGEPFDARMVARGAKVCVVGQTIVRELFEGENPIGKNLRVQNVTFKVIGVLKQKGANMMGWDQDDVIIMPWTTMKSRLKGAGSTSLTSSNTTTTTTTTTTSSTSDLYTSGVSLYPEASTAVPPVRFVNVDSLIIAAHNPESVEAALAEVTASLRETHKLGPEDEDDFRVRTMTEFSDFLTSQTKSTTNLLLCVAFISLIVGGVGIMNIMLVSVTERTREIGLRMAVGARGSDILRQFLIESIVICLLGGVLGIVLGHSLSMLLGNLMGWPVMTSYAAIALSVGVSVLVGILFGYYPAWKAARLDPIEALRYE